MTVHYTWPPGGPEKWVAGLQSTDAVEDLRVGRSQSSKVLPGWHLLSSFQMTLESNHYFQSREPVAQPDPDFQLFFVDEEPN